MKFFILLLTLSILLILSNGQQCNVTYNWNNGNYPTQIAFPDCMGSNLANIYRYQLWYTTIDNSCASTPTSAWPPTCSITQIVSYTMDPQSTNLCLTSNKIPDRGVASSGCSSTNANSAITTDPSSCSGSTYCGVGTGSSSYWVGNTCDFCPCACELDSSCSLTIDNYLYCNILTYEIFTSAVLVGGSIFSISVNSTRSIKIQNILAGFKQPTSGTLTASIWYQVGSILNTSGSAWTLWGSKVVTLFFSAHYQPMTLPDFEIAADQNVFFFIGAVSSNGQSTLVETRTSSASNYYQNDKFIQWTAVGSTTSYNPTSGFTLNTVGSGSYPPRNLGQMSYCLYF